jgi:hypothetical protein
MRSAWFIERGANSRVGMDSRGQGRRLSLLYPTTPGNSPKSSRESWSISASACPPCPHSCGSSCNAIMYNSKTPTNTNDMAKEDQARRLPRVQIERGHPEMNAGKQLRPAGFRGETRGRHLAHLLAGQKRQVVDGIDKPFLRRDRRRQAPPPPRAARWPSRPAPPRDRPPRSLSLEDWLLAPMPHRPWPARRRHAARGCPPASPAWPRLNSRPGFRGGSQREAAV